MPVQSIHIQVPLTHIAKFPSSGPTTAPPAPPRAKRREPGIWQTGNSLGCGRGEREGGKGEKERVGKEERMARGQGENMELEGREGRRDR